ncbi:hypothetical protein CXG81DRAFT_4386, partial [Caulochytrium protostelioides]
MMEAQRIDEGRRMFQVFAARMFELRVMAAYHAWAAEQRREQFLKELEAEENQSRALKARGKGKKQDKVAKAR